LIIGYGRLKGQQSQRLSLQGITAEKAKGLQQKTLTCSVKLADSPYRDECHRVSEADPEGQL